MYYSQVPASTAAMLAIASVGHAALFESPIRIKDGLVQGQAALNDSTVSNFANWQDIGVWKGIPYAATTGGQNRWKPPQPATPWNTTLAATSFGPGCPQASEGGGTVDQSEDCLSVNIWSAAKSADAKLPVAVWSYGSGGTSSDDDINGAAYANDGVVFVSYNYRVGPFGFLGLPELSQESPHNVSGNYGLLDNIEVLKWIKANIASFGGDPDHVTTVGQSFGSGLVYHSINSPLAKGLIVGAIAESGIKSPFDPDYDGYGSGYTTYPELYPFSETFAESLNATTVAELRELTTDELLDGTGASAFTSLFIPVLDHYVMPSTYLESLLHKPVNDVPILVGNNYDEDGISLSQTYNVSAYIDALDSRYNETWADIFFKLYPANDTTDATNAYFDQLRNEFTVSTWNFASLWSIHGTTDVYTYLWNHAPANSSSGATHGSEISFVLNSLWAQTSEGYLQDDYEVADTVSSYWVNFIKTGNPNGVSASTNETLAHWPASNKSNATTFTIGDTYEEILLATKLEIKTILDWFHNVTVSPY